MWWQKKSGAHFHSDRWHDNRCCHDFCCFARPLSVPILFLTSGLASSTCICGIGRHWEEVPLGWQWVIRSTSTADHSAIYAIWCDPMLVMMTIFKDDDLDDQARDNWPKGRFSPCHVKWGWALYNSMCLSMNLKKVNQLFLDALASLDFTLVSE